MPGILRPNKQQSVYTIVGILLTLVETGVIRAHINFNTSKEGKMKRGRAVINSMVPLTFIYEYRVGIPMDDYLKGLAEGKILGSKCPECGKVAVPPRLFCGQCNVEMKEMVEVKQEGTLQNWTVADVKVSNGDLVGAEAPYVIGMIKLENASSLITSVVKGVKPEDLKPGIRLKASWKAQREGALADLECFVPA
jgi:uncharacterized OB-fold protein